MKEDVLVEKILAGENSYFEQLMKPYQLSLLNIAYRMAGDAEEAKEICQEAVLKIYKYLNRFKKGASFKNWAYKVVVNESYDFLRKSRRQQRIVSIHKRENVLEDSFTPENAYSDWEVKNALRNCLFVLTPKERSVFLLRDGEEFSIKETASILGFSSSSVRTHLSRARRKIRSQLEKTYFQEPRRWLS